jgi:hypothetical protein
MKINHLATLAQTPIEKNGLQISIPDVSMIGIRCPTTTFFCCRARSFVKPYLNSNDWAELFAAVKRLKVEQQVSL